MKKRLVCYAFLMVSLIASSPVEAGPSVGVESALPVPVDFRPPEIIPAPKKLNFRSDVPVRINSETRFNVSCGDIAAADWVKGKVETWFSVKDANVSFMNVSKDLAGGDEAYALNSQPGIIDIAANTLKGVKWAMQVLRQCAERESGGAVLKGYWLPALNVKDAPSLPFRGIHFCWFPECSAKLIERQIRVAACYRFNYVVLESWGVFRSERHPYLSVSNAPLTVSEARRLAAVAKDLGVTLIPQVNIYGHAAFARARGGKHVTLDYHPERQPLFEPGGWNWCLSNPAARSAVNELVLEMHEAFGNPPFFHIGCDEADPPTCPTCRTVKPYAKLVESHIAEVAGLLRKRGARAMMWHDMLIEKGKWSPFYAHGTADDAKMLETLPRDIVICDWYYGSDPGGAKADAGTSVTDRYPTLDHFASKGYSVLTCPWREKKGIAAQARYAVDKGLFGVLETVWHHYSGLEFVNMVEISACGAWGATRNDPNRRGRPFAINWRRCGWDMGVPAYEETGFYDRQVSRDALSE